MTRPLSALALSVSLALVTSTAALGQSGPGFGYPSPSNCPPGSPCYNGSDGWTVPGSNLPPGTTLPPFATEPSIGAPTQVFQQPGPPQGFQQPGMQQPGFPQPLADPFGAPSLGNMGMPSGPGPGLAGLSGGAQTPMLGRVDSNNRLNIFDNQSAIPQSRIWVGYQNAQDQDPGIRLQPGYGGEDLAAINPGTNGDIAGRNDTDIFRVGVELAITPRFSITGQGQHVWPYGTNDAQEDWTNPQLLLKHVLVRSPTFTMSGVFGATFETGTQRNVINDTQSRILIGGLYYGDVSPELFSQGGFGFGIPTGQDVATFDWSVGLGWWMYRHGSVVTDPRFRYGGCVDCGCNQPFIRGIAPSISFLGKHVLGDNDSYDPFNGLNTIDFGGPTPLAVAQYEEPRHIVDITVGGTVLIRHGLSLNLGYSFPITGARARDDEFLMALNWYY